ncbi:hypothetical protein D3C81_1703430 [compost metagenome]
MYIHKLAILAISRCIGQKILEDAGKQLPIRRNDHLGRNLQPGFQLVLFKKRIQLFIELEQQLAEINRRLNHSKHSIVHSRNLEQLFNQLLQPLRFGIGNHGVMPCLLRSQI